MDPETWKRFVQKIDVNAPLESVYAAWATAEGMMGWFPMEVLLMDSEGGELGPGSAAGVGDRYKFTWHMGHSEEGVFTEANGTDRLRFSSGEDMAVTVMLEQMEDGSVMVTMEQSQDKSDEENLKILLGYKEGWAFYLANLKSVLEGGLDLRNYTHDIENRINY